MCSRFFFDLWLFDYCVDDVIVMVCIVEMFEKECDCCIVCWNVVFGVCGLCLLVYRFVGEVDGIDECSVEFVCL